MTPRRLLGMVCLGALCLGLVRLAPVFLGSNFHAVVPGRVFRSGQLSASELEERIERHEIRSIINLRGDKEERDWYREEVEVASRRGLAMRSLDLVPERLPSRPDVAALIDFLETLPEPILIHCSAGADRTGFASVVARMAKGGAVLEEAREELGLDRGHLPFGPATEIGRIFDQYEAHQRESRAPEGWERFEAWAREVYVPYVYSARLELESFPALVEPGERMDLQIRIRNTSPGPWAFTSDPNRGIKLGVRLRRETSESGWVDYDRHGPLEGALPTGAEIEFPISVSAPPAEGAYELKLDMVDEHVTWFEDQGSPPLVLPLVVRSSEPDPPP